MFLTETYTDLHLSHRCGQRSDGVKPRRGGLFIATDAPNPFFLFVGGAAFAKRIAAKVPASNHVLDTEMIHAPRRRKTKRKGKICVFPYKQATPTRFMTQPTNSLPHIRQLKMCVMTSPGTGAPRAASPTFNRGVTTHPESRICADGIDYASS